MAIGIGGEQPPESTDIRLREYLSRQFILLNIALEQNNDFDILYVHPDKFRVGKLYYYGAAIAGDSVVDAEGLYLYKSTGLVKVI